MAHSKDVVVTGVSTGIGWGTTKGACFKRISRVPALYASRPTLIVCKKSSVTASCLSRWT